MSVTHEDMLARPAVSRATAVSVCAPFATPLVFHENEYGAATQLSRASNVHVKIDRASGSTSAA